MKKIYYIGFYSDPSVNSKRKTAPAADTKMAYIIESMKEIGYEVEVLSFCSEDDRNVVFQKKEGYEIYQNGTKIVFFSNYVSKYRILRVFGRFLSWRNIKKYLSKECINNDSKIVMYHSLGLLKVIKLFNKKKQKFILEMEEVYADVIGNARIKKKEIKMARSASGYIFPTKLLDSEINIKNKPSVIIHGTYKTETIRKCKIFNNSKDDVIHCVYAGTFDPRKGGAAAAVAAAEFLPSQYHIHIIGFGSIDEVEKMKKHIQKIQKKSLAKVSYDGLLLGDDYIKFIQSCDIGLSTQNPDAAFNATSFPSKILSYLANGLRVVSIRIPAIEQSAVGDKLYYYDNQTPEQIAKAILSINMKKTYDSRQLITKLSDKFKRDLLELID